MQVFPELVSGRYNTCMGAGEKNIHFYDVALALPATWRMNIFTYHYPKKINQGQIVKAPFGNKLILGYVVARTTKPFVTKTKALEPIQEMYSISKPSRLFLTYLLQLYPSMPGIHIQHMLPSFIPAIPQTFEVYEKTTPVKPPKLTSVQNSAINALLSNNSAQVLHGVTGSGKTRVYLELIIKTLKEGNDVLLLYPEISLSNHTRASLEPYIDSGLIHTYHSNQTKLQQRNTWQSALSSEGGQLFLGPRSALFLPYRKLGLVIVDEAHDGSYKEDTGNRYHGLYVAAKLAQAHNAKLVLGSATPPVTETNFIQTRKTNIVCMHSLAIKDIEHDRELQVVSMKDRNNHSSINLISKPLLQSIEKSISNRRQSLLFLNRRGTARSVFCDNCGWRAECRRCESSLTYHHDLYQLRCHLCGLKQSVQPTCPDCRSALSQKSAGIKSLEYSLKKYFPSARIARFDSDNSKAESFAERFHEIAKGDTDIILGTQIVTKGLDLPNLETVGILQAEASLLLPDFSSQERTFQQLIQVSGRVGRGHIPGHVYIQSFEPGSKLLSQVVNGNWHEFYDHELRERKANNFPPYSFMLKIWTKKKKETTAQDSIMKISQKISDAHKNIKILGPAPAFYAKTDGQYVWQIVITASSRRRLTAILNDLPKDFYFDLDPVSLL